MKSDRSDDQHKSMLTNSDFLGQLLQTTTISKDNDQILDEYIMNSIQWCYDYAERTAVRKQQAINFYMVMFSALVSGVALIFTTSQNDTLKLTSLIIASAIISGFGILTYFWILESEAERISESFFLFWLHKYFRDKNPYSFENYNLHRMVYHYNAFDRKTASSISPAGYATFSILIIFSSLSFSLFTYILIDKLLGVTIGTSSMLISFILGSVCLSLMISLLIIVIKRLEFDRCEGEKILMSFHQERHPKDKAAYLSHKPGSKAVEQAVAKDHNDLYIRRKKVDL